MLTLQDEIPVPDIPKVPYWSENYCFDGYDFETRVGFWIHIGRWSLDPAIWRERIFVFLPDGSFVVRRTWGKRENLRGPSGALLDLECVEAGREWRLRYHGPARPTTAAELEHDAPLREAPEPMLDFDVTFRSDLPVWEMRAAAEGQIWGDRHDEQLGSVDGTIAFAGATHSLSGVGFRDHSRGPRHMKSAGGHCWLHGRFPGGRGFAAFDFRELVDGVPVRTLKQAVIWDGGKIYPATIPEPPYLTAVHNPGDYRFTLESELGAMEIEGETRPGLPHSTTTLFESFVGIVPPPFANHVCWEQPTIFRWNGQVGHGHSERTALFPR